MPSVFTVRPESDWVASNELAFAIRDGYPVSPGHTLVIPRREVANWFDASPAEQAALVDLIGIVKAQLDTAFHPDGYNVGFNAGEAAGQTVMHLHVHVIPRYSGDVPDPTGGVRHVVPGKGNYLTKVRPPASSVSLGGTNDPFLSHVRPLFKKADQVDIVAAFAQDSGLVVLEPEVSDLLARGGSIRFLTGDYLAISQVEALERLLEWSAIPPTLDGGGLEDVPSAGSFEARVIETARLDPPGTSFHPKCWMFEATDFGVAYVGSSNVSRSALQTGIEWNLRADRSSQGEAWTRLRQGFEDLWDRAARLTSEWIQEYELRAVATPIRLPFGEEETEPTGPFPMPHRLQVEALEALARTRAEGRTRALVVLATGLGKTWLSAFDLAVLKDSLGRFPRVLFLAHRREILDQAASVLMRTARHHGAVPRITYYAGSASDLSGDVVLASTQKLARPAGLDALEDERFDYAVVDEVHHAAADGYRRILARLDAGFILGLTATPDRADGVDIEGLFDDNRLFEAGVAEGIVLGRLVPFRYWGIRDTVDYAQIPWRNRRFDVDALEAAAATEARMDRLWDEWEKRPASRSLVFCCSVRHATFVSEWLAGKGVAVEVVTGETPAAERQDALDRLAAGAMSALCSVDVFNEGVDIPAVDRVVMLRPTESSVLFLQQLGRGLRIAEGKNELTVIDFVGNHRVFLDRVAALLSLAASPVGLRQFLASPTSLELPPGCSVDVEMEAVDLLRSLLPRGENEVIRAYRDFRAVRGRRPRAGELYRSGYLPSRLRGWFDFVSNENDFGAEERLAYEEGVEWLRDLEATPMEKSFKMVVLEVLLENQGLPEGLPVDVLAKRCHELLARSPELIRDIEGVARFPDPRNPDPEVWLTYWRENPIRAWTQGMHGRWFELADGRFRPRQVAWPKSDSIVEMTRELVDYRLAQYRRRFQGDAGGISFDCKVTWNKRDPILKLPDRAARPGLPAGDIDVRLPDGSPWRFRFASQFCNVARPSGSGRNELPDLLRKWFGPAAGKPGTNFHVRFITSPDGLWTEPVDTKVLQFRARSTVKAYLSLRAAAGAARRESFSAFEAADGDLEVTLPVTERGADHFAVRASGSSMDGGKDPIRDGDWVVLKWARGAALKNLRGRICLVETSDPEGEAAYQLKRIARDSGRWLLNSDNPAIAPIPASEDSLPIATLVDVIRPEALAPAVGAILDEAALAKAFGLDGSLRTGHAGGHLFVLVDSPGQLPSPDRLAFTGARHPGETAFVLAKGSEAGLWRYCGVGRWIESEGLWAIPELDYATFRRLGSGRDVSRRLPRVFEEEAEELVTRTLSRSAESGGWLPGVSREVRVCGRSAQGGLRIDGGPGGFGERTVSLVDLGWVLAARAESRTAGGSLDEAWVNRVRYLEGTPRSSTRWIDTGHAIAVVNGDGP